MELMIDANIVIDVLQDRKPFSDCSRKIMQLCESNRCSGSISALSFANIVYVLRKHLNRDDINLVLQKLSLILKIRDLKSIDLSRASMLWWNDYEDAIQSVTASRIKADYIVTRNTTDYINSKIPAINPEKLLKTIASGS